MSLICIETMKSLSNRVRRSREAGAYEKKEQTPRILEREEST